MLDLVTQTVEYEDVWKILALSSFVGDQYQNKYLICCEGGINIKDISFVLSLLCTFIVKVSQMLLTFLLH